MSRTTAWRKRLELSNACAARSPALAGIDGWRVMLGELHAVAGQCACGRVTFACRIEAETAVCSCDLCRRNSGSAFQAWVDGSRASLQVSGETSSWASTDYATRHFCTRCGSPLFLFEQEEPDVVEIAAGSLAAPDGIASARESRAHGHQRPAWDRASLVKMMGGMLDSGEA